MTDGLRSKIKSVVAAFAVLATAPFFQNCSAYHGSGTESLELSSEAAFDSAKVVLERNCVSCHSPSGTQSATPMNFSSPHEFIAAGLIVPGEPDQSKLLQRIRGGDLTAQNNALRNMPPSDTISPTDYQILKRWILAMGASSSVSPFTCSPGVDPLAAMPAKAPGVMGDAQYKNTLTDFVKLALGGASTALVNDINSRATFPNESAGRYSKTVPSLSRERLAVHFRIVSDIGTAFGSATYANTVLRNILQFRPGACSGFSSVTTTSLSAVCKDQFIRNLGLQLYRRPLLETVETNELQTFRTEFDSAADAGKGIDNLVVRLLMSQNFLFHMEDQEVPLGSDPKLFQLSSYSIANRLSYTFWNTMPDQQLYDMAQNFDLRSNVKFVEALNYVLGSSRLDATLKEFARGYLHLDKMPHFQSGGSNFQQFSNGLTFDSNMRKAMIDEAEELVSFIVRSDGSLADIFLTDVSFARHTPLMNLYGVSTPAPTSMTMANAVRLPAAERAGILTRAAMLSTESGFQDVIHRAVRIKRDLLCLNQLPPPADTTPPVPLTEEQFSSFNIRERVAHNTGQGTCISCHQTINPFGYALSEYNGLGIFKRTEPAFYRSGAPTGQQLSVSAQTDLTGIFSVGRRVASGVDLSQQVAHSSEVKTCFTRNYSNYFLDRVPNMVSDGCRLNRFYTIINRNGSLKDAMSTIATDVEFRHRKMD